jgi:hypothetical protein
MISDAAYAHAVADFLSNRGATLRPTVCIVPTSAKISDADNVALRSYAGNSQGSVASTPA